jgi:hypothetical protein
MYRSFTISIQKFQQADGNPHHGYFKTREVEAPASDMSEQRASGKDIEDLLAENGILITIKFDRAAERSVVRKIDFNLMPFLMVLCR